MTKMSDLGRVIEPTEGMPIDAAKKDFPTLFINKAPVELSLLEAGEEGEAVIKFKVSSKSVEEADNNTQKTNMALQIMQIGMKDNVRILS